MHGNRRSAPSPNPRVKARPFSMRLHPLLIASSLSAVCIALALPYSPVASWLGFVPIPATLLAALALASTDAKIAEWKTKREVAHLKSRADNAETYAAAAAVIALASVDEAEQAALEAWLARKDVESVQTAKAA